MFFFHINEMPREAIEIETKVEQIKSAQKNSDQSYDSLKSNDTRFEPDCLVFNIFVMKWWYLSPPLSVYVVKLKN